MQAAREKVVSIEYTLTDDDGDVLDSSRGRGPLSYLHGAGNIVPGLERAIEGKRTGETLSVVVPPADGYGDHDPELVQPVPRDRFPAGVEVEVGDEFEARTPAGPRLVSVIDVDEENVTIDANHPLAGRALHFEVEVVDVRDATAEELRHGHAHGPGGHHHGH